MSPEFTQFAWIASWSIIGLVIFTLLCMWQPFQACHLLTRFGALILAGPLCWAITVLMAVSLLIRHLTRPRYIPPRRVPREAPRNAVTPRQALQLVLDEHLTVGSGTYLSDKAFQIASRALRTHNETKR
jgi:hypothetical protein